MREDDFGHVISKRTSVLGAGGILALTRRWRALKKPLGSRTIAATSAIRALAGHSGSRTAFQSRSWRAPACPFIGGVSRSDPHVWLSLQLQRAASQLPVSSYFDGRCSGANWRPSFSAGPASWGATRRSRTGTLAPCRRKAKDETLVHTRDGIELLSMSAGIAGAVMLRAAACCQHERRLAHRLTCTAGPIHPRVSCWARRASAGSTA